MGLTLRQRTIPITIWKGCYEQPWGSRIVPAAFAHPAKVSRALLVRIYNYLRDRAVLYPGETVLDPFAGIGTTAIEGANRGIHVICVELEPKFVELAQANVEKYRRFWTGMGYPIPVIVQGDSRYLRTVLTNVDVIISSPPYAAGGQSNSAKSVDAQQLNAAAQAKYPGWCVGKNEWVRAYGKTEGQLGILKEGNLNAVISSPPYAGSFTQGNNAENYDYTRYGGGGQLATSQRYGTTEGQMETMAFGKVDVVIGVPPYEGRVNDKRPMGGGIDWTKVAERTSGPNSQGRNPFRYGRGEGQIGAETGETFWKAAHQVVQETYAVLKPGGVAVWLTKAFVRDKQYVDFPGDWRRLCEHVGFETHEEIRALFAYERRVKGTMKQVVRKSFFRRLAEQNGAPPIDWETIWIMQKPLKPRRQGSVIWR